MIRITAFTILTVIMLSCSPSETIFDLSPQQSMSITGKGPGQDAAFNPYADTKSIAVVTSLSANPFTIRIQYEEKVINEIVVNREEEKEVILEQGYELYLDSQLVSRAQVKFKRFQAN